MNKIKEQLPMALLASLTLGLAPFVPEPHIAGKLRWIAGGAVGMQLIDWLDFIFHGFPWMLLLIKAGLLLKKELNQIFQP